MKEKKQSPHWYIAITHYLTAGFVIPLLVMIGTLYLVAWLFILYPDILAKLNEVIVSLFMLIAIWLGVIYSAKFIDKKYIIIDSAKVINYSTGIMVILFIISRIIELVSKGLNMTLVINLVYSVLAITIFYFTSKKYVHNTQGSEISNNNATSSTPKVTDYSKSI